MAEERLQQPKITDQDVLAVLKLLYFKRNDRRQNVLPYGSTFVHSDTFGLVRTRTGSIVPSRVTAKFGAAFAVMCRWLKENTPETFRKPFPFTGISVNYAYAARKHRDQFNSGPSMTKSFGDFHGGRLIYWPNDDGERDVQKLAEEDALSFDSSRQLVLFDGRRGHMVSANTGERYNLVFFTVSDYQKTKLANIERSKSC